jgi:hypothetical protein
MKQHTTTKRTGPLIAPDRGYVLHGKFLPDAQANRLALSYPELITRLRPAVKLPDGRIILQRKNTL